MKSDGVSHAGMGKIKSVSGPVVKACQLTGAKMFELVRVGNERLLGEIIALDRDIATIQVYEDTCGLKKDEPVERTYGPLLVALGPGIQRPLNDIYEQCKNIYVPKGISIPPINLEKKWHFYPNNEIKIGDFLASGTSIGYVEENILIKHYVLVEPNVSGTVTSKVEEGKYCVTDVLMTLKSEKNQNIDVKMIQYWPVRKSRPIKRKLTPSTPLFTGQRILDALFPCTQGGTVAIPGAFGCGKTVISQSISKYSNSDVVVYVGCGERGNEMAEVLRDFPELTIEKDNQTVSIMNRTTLVANTSNMPVSAREASIYTGITIAEYFRDQGYHVSLMADSTSRWAEALREISGRLGEMPADSGYPAYLSSRLAAFYERGGYVECLGSDKDKKQGSVTIVGAVSPPSEDMSDPVTTATLSIVHCFWGLDKKLAMRKHFPSLNWNSSYSNCRDALESHYMLQDSQFLRTVAKCREILHAENELSEVVQLVGRGSLAELDKLKLDLARIVREDFLQQNGISDYDAFQKTALMLKSIIFVFEKSEKLISATESAANSYAAYPKSEKVITWTILKDSLEKRGVFRMLSSLKFIMNSDVSLKIPSIHSNIERIFFDLQNATY